MPIRLLFDWTIEVKKHFLRQNPHKNTALVKNGGKKASGDKSILLSKTSALDPTY